MLEKVKNVSLIVLASVAACLGVIVSCQNDKIADQDQQIIDQKNLTNDLQRSLTTLTTKKELEKWITDNNLKLDEIKKDLRKFNGDIVAVNQLIAQSLGSNRDNLPSLPSNNPRPPQPVVTVPCPSGGEVTCPSTDPFGHMTNVRWFALEEPFGSTKVPFGRVGFDASKPADKAWSERLLARQYKITTVLAEDEYQRKIAYNKFDVVVGDKTYSIPIQKSEIKQVAPKPKFHWFNPIVSMGVDGAVSLEPKVDAGVHAEVSILSYGQYKLRPDYRFLGVGASYMLDSKEVGVSVRPVDVNLHQFFPIVRNTYVGPSVTFTTQKNLFIGLGIGLAL